MASSSSLSSSEKDTYATTFTDSRLWIGISGIIGVGKTTLTKKIAKEFNITAEYEPVKENVYLDDFYSDMKGNGFKMQIYLLSHRYNQHQKIVWSGKSAVQDRTIYEDVIFAKMLYEAGLMDARDFKSYKSLFEIMNNFLHRPDMIIYLDCDVKVAYERVQKRKANDSTRNCEKTVSLEYLQSLKKGYEDWLENVVSKKVPVLRINYNTIPSDEEMLKIIKNFIIDNKLERKIYI